jgi:uncharacterized protein with HEPN domain
VSRRDRQRLEDILVAIAVIRSHLERGDLHDGLVFDAVRVRLIEIGKAVKALPPELLAHEPALPWKKIKKDIEKRKRKGIKYKQIKKKRRKKITNN